ncbi:NAD(P)-dependent oxidoreductase [Tropicimonas sp. IMCC34043]|uniref:NAD-dependent epimerase/dehydratase family protein n=1 Tax=Tropicimonas sp. IMCC34043 TaxID=2248760 RepID=UPI000E264062|nr:NAD(P)-dependent oxidoreductase [Tropicimonas sp. IMCC34043]
MLSRDDTILMTGATGFLGSWIIARLADKGVKVVATDISTDHRRLNMLRPGLARGAVDFRTCDVTDGAALEALVAETRPTAIIHLAALQIPQCRSHPALAAAINVGGHVNVFEAARKSGIDRVIYTSSIAAKPRGPAQAPSNLYGVFKKTDEEIARIYWQDHGLSSLGLRPYIVYGVGRDDGETSAITRAIEAAALGRDYELPFRTRSSFQYAGDVAEVFAIAAGRPWQGALLSDVSDTVQSTDEVLEAIRVAVPESRVSGAEVERISPDSGFDTAALREVIGHWQETPLVDGIRETVALFREIAARAGGAVAG